MIFRKGLIVFQNCCQSVNYSKTLSTSTSYLNRTIKMPSQNIEIKAKMTIGLEEATTIALELAKVESLSTLIQEDVFFHCPNGRLKLRKEVQDGSETAMLIAYSRPDVTGPKVSAYVKTVVPDSEGMEDALTRSLGVRGKVFKKRFFTVVDRDGLKTRIHLDIVEQLGHFIEFEVMIDNKHSVGSGERMAKFLSEAFQIQDSDLIDGAYLNMLEERGISCIVIQ